VSQSAIDGKVTAEIQYGMRGSGPLLRVVLAGNAGVGGTSSGNAGGNGASGQIL
jgi:hypothetical protein